MYDLSDTIVAVSSPPSGVRSIVRITGPETRLACKPIFRRHDRVDAVAQCNRTRSCSGPGLSGRRTDADRSQPDPLGHPGIHCGWVRITETLALDARLYLFLAPHSYTGEDLAEIHIDASPILVEALVHGLLAHGLRPAGPGEFTARAYLNGKLDLAQAEAVNEVISSSNRLQLEAAERLLGGRLTQEADEIRADLLEILSLIEAGLDFSGEEIEFISPEQATRRLLLAQNRLETLLAGSIRYETLLDLPAVGIAGAPNAGKSSLLNALLGWQRSIVSAQARTTRDVLTGVLKTDRLQCVLFDCAGLIPAPGDILDELSQRAAVEALQNCQVVLFCIDAAKPDWSEDIAIRALIRPKSLIHLATKCDLLTKGTGSKRVGDLGRIFGADLRKVSARNGLGLQELIDSLERVLAYGTKEKNDLADGPGDGEPPFRAAAATISSERTPHVALTARHKQAVTDAIENVRQAAAEVRRGSDEVTAMMIRAAHQALSEIEHQPVDEQVLDLIFTRFCIGK